MTAFMETCQTPAFDIDCKAIAKCYGLCHHANLRISLDRLSALLAAGGDENFLTVVAANSHQNRIRKDLKSKAADLLLERIAEIQILRDFESIFEALKSIISNAGIKNSNSLWAYDVALRVGHSCGVAPRRYVYLFRGAAAGAKYLTGINQPTRIETEKMTQYFPGLEPKDIENLLCICKECIKRGAPSNKCRRCHSPHETSC